MKDLYCSIQKKRRTYMYYKTADLCDENQNKKIQVLSPEFKNYGGLKGFYGQIITIKLNYSTFAHRKS